MALMLDSDDEDEGGSQVLTLSVCGALTGELLEEVTMSASDTVMDLASSLVQSAGLECLPRLLLGTVALEAADTLAQAGLKSRDRVLAVVCPYQAVATTSHDHTVRIWNAATGECQRVLEGHSNYVHCACFSPDGRFLVTGSHDRLAIVWWAATGRVHLTLGHHHSYVKAVAYSPDGKTLATGSGDCTAMVWDAESGEPRSWEVPEGDEHVRTRWTLQGHMSSVNSVSFAPDGIRLATGSEDRTAMVWDLQTGLPMLTLKGHSSHTYACFAPDGRQIATASEDKTARLWDASTGECLRTLEGHSKFIRSIAWSPDSRWVATASGDTTAKVWSADTGVCEQTLPGHSSFVYSVAFSPDGLSLMTGSADGTARLWDWGSGGCNQVFSGHKKQVLSAVFGPARRGEAH